MFPRFILAVLLADLIGAVGVLSADGIVSGGIFALRWDVIYTFGSLSMLFAALPLAVAMSLALLILHQGEHPQWAESWWGAVAIGGAAGALIWSLLTGGTLPAMGAGYGAAAGFSLWACFRGRLDSHSMRARST